MKPNLPHKRSRSAAGRNPFQEKAVKNQTPRWSKQQGKPGEEAIPPALLPHPLVDARLADPPPGSEGAEAVTGDDGDSGSYEDESAN
jgi:hypothetical protein